MQIIFVHFPTGTASPNKRPTIFDVFRPRKNSDSKKKDKDGTNATSSKSASSDRDSSGGSANGSGGIMHSVKQVIAGSATPKTHSSQTSKVRDGSAHVHGTGSDAQVRFNLQEI